MNLIQVHKEHLIKLVEMSEIEVTCFLLLQNGTDHCEGFVSIKCLFYFFAVDIKRVSWDF